ncbi:unnamed protein product [Owenia fusiformis]|uniref:Uncharacterized protein n=1 Tax=Owenia fusiformis TaxID=6347 RepID=A0A8S4MX00_OWEFU|nr:unnamed protein product [Owenia fusiformis]
MAGGWAPENDDKGQWIQAALGEIMFVTGVVTQGEEKVDHWVISYKFLYGKTVETLEEYRKILQGNNDRNTHVTNMIDPHVLARFVRINPQTWYKRIAMRFDVIGCPKTVAQCPMLPDPPIGHTRISQLDGLYNGAIVQNECLPGNHYYSGDFVKKCIAYNSSDAGEWVGDDLICRGCCDFEKTPDTTLVYNFNTLSLGPVDILQGNATIQRQGRYVGLNTMPSGVLNIQDQILSGQLELTFCIETWIDIISNTTNTTQQNETDKHVIIEVSNTFGLTITNNSNENIKFIAFFNLKNETVYQSITLDMEFLKDSNLLQIVMTKVKDVVVYFVNGVQVFSSVTEEEIFASMNETTREFVVSVTGDVTLYSIRLQDTSCFDTVTYKNVQRQRRTGCENGDNSIKLSCARGDVLVVHTVEVGQSNSSNGINRMCEFLYDPSCAIQLVKTQNLIKEMCDEHNECMIAYHDYTELRPDTCDMSHSVTAVVTYQCIRKINANSRNLSSTMNSSSEVMDLFPYETCVSTMEVIEFDMGAYSQIDELILYFNVSSTIATNKAKLVNIKVSTNDTEAETKTCSTNATVTHSMPVLYDCGDSVFGNLVALEIEGRFPGWMICNVEIYSKEVAFQTISPVIEIDDTTTTTGETTKPTDETTTTTDEPAEATETAPAATETAANTIETAAATTDSAQETSETALITTESVPRSTEIAPGTTETTKTAPETTESALRTNETTLIISGTIPATTYGIIPTTTETSPTSTETDTPSTGFTKTTKTTPLEIFLKVEEDENANEYVAAKRIELEPTEAKYAAAVGIPVCVPPIIFISTLILLDLPKLVQDLRQAYNYVVYGTKVKPKVGQKSPILN